MAMKCENCGKGVMYGHNVSHSKRRTQKIFKPNLHVARISVGGRMTKAKLCVKCLRMYKAAATLSEMKETDADAKEAPQDETATA